MCTIRPGNWPGLYSKHLVAYVLRWTSNGALVAETKLPSRSPHNSSWDESHTDVSPIQPVGIDPSDVHVGVHM